MDADGFPLAVISEKSNIDDDTITPIKPARRGKRVPFLPSDSMGGVKNGDISTSKSHQAAILETSTHSEQPAGRNSTNVDHSRKFNNIEVTSIQDEDDDNEREERFASQRPSQFTNDRDSTMLSSYSAPGGENDVIEIHQFSLGDVDAYLDIYFETLDNRLRHYIGEDEQLQQFRVSMKNRISKNKKPITRKFLFLFVRF
jgi:hypothetical protein